MDSVEDIAESACESALPADCIWLSASDTEERSMLAVCVLAVLVDSAIDGAAAVDSVCCVDCDAAALPLPDGAPPLQPASSRVVAVTATEVAMRRPVMCGMAQSSAAAAAVY